MKTVRRYLIMRHDGSQPGIVSVPRRAKPIHFGMLGGALYLWAEVDPDEGLEGRVFRAYVADSDIPLNAVHIGSVSGMLEVWHVYEVRPIRHEPPSPREGG